MDQDLCLARMRWRWGGAGSPSERQNDRRSMKFKEKGTDAAQSVFHITSAFLHCQMNPVVTLALFSKDGGMSTDISFMSL